MERYEHFEDWLSYEIERLNNALKPSDAMLSLMGQEACIEKAQHLIELPCNDMLSYCIEDGQIQSIAVNKLENSPFVYLEQQHSNIRGYQVEKLKQHLAAELEVLKANNYRNDATAFDIGHGTSPRLIRLRKRELIRSPLWTEGKKTHIGNMSTLAIAILFKASFIIGGAGSGKSTATKQIALSLLEGIKSYKEEDNHLLKTNQTKAINQNKTIPLLFYWAEFWRFYKKSARKNLDINLLFEYFESEYGKPGLKSFLQYKLERGELILIGDGIDEISEKGKSADETVYHCLKWMENLRDSYTEIGVIFTSRPIGKDLLEQLESNDEINITKLHGLDLWAQQELVQRLFRTCDASMNRRCLDDETFQTLIKKIPEELKSTPLFLIIVFSLFINDEAADINSKNSGVLIGKFIHLLIEVWNESRNSDNDKTFNELIQKDKNEVHAILSRYALEKVKSNLAKDPTYVLLFDCLRTNDYQLQFEISDYITKHSGILVKPSKNLEEFAHRDFRDYLAAQELVRNYIKEADFPSFLFEQIEKCAEVIRFTASILLEDKRAHLIWQMFLEIMNDSRSANQKRVGVLIAQIINDLEMGPEKSKAYSLINDYGIPEVKKFLEDLLWNGSFLSPIDRMEVSIALGYLGDNRDGVGVCEGLPNIKWCSISAGLAKFGSEPGDLDQIEKYFGRNFDTSREQPAFEQALDAYEISKFPVTISQFECFLLEPNGYINDEWWDNSPRDSVESWRGRIEAARTKNLPVTNITWFEASAFAMWLSKKLNADIRLPTEIQWEKAARGEKGHIYPWGNSPLDYDSNIKETGILKLTPVGTFNTKSYWGDNGPNEMVGNIWEWCSTTFEIERAENTSQVYKYPYQNDDGRENNIRGSSNCKKVTRGGYYRYDALLSRCSFRGRDLPTERLNRQGFRLVKVG